MCICPIWSMRNFSYIFMHVHSLSLFFHRKSDDDELVYFCNNGVVSYGDPEIFV